MPADLFSRLGRILEFAKIVADELVCKETEILEKTIPQMFEVMQDVAKITCMYVKRQYGVIFSAIGGADGRLAERSFGGLIHGETIEDMGRKLVEVIEDFDRAMDIEALRQTKKMGKHSLSQRYTMLICVVQRRSFCLDSSKLPRPAII